MGKIAFCFPGQGALEAGMGRELAEAVPAAPPCEGPLRSESAAPAPDPGQAPADRVGMVSSPAPQAALAVEPQSVKVSCGIDGKDLTPRQRAVRAKP